MANFNKVILIGNLVRDPELRYTPKGSAIAKISLAINRVWTNEAGDKKEDVTFVECDCWGRTAENVAQYVKKGNPLMIEGRLKLDTWDDKETGQKRSRLGVVAETVQFIHQKPQGSVGEQERAQGTSKPEKRAKSSAASAEPVAGDEPREEDDVPF